MFSSISDPELRIVLALGVAALVATLGLVLQVLVMRWRAQRHAARRQAMQAQWRPLLMRAALDGDAGSPLPALPTLPSGVMANEWLLLWNQLQDSLRGSAHEGLNRLALSLGVPPLARRLARETATSPRVLGLQTLGHLASAADASDQQLLRDAMRSRRTVVSLTAARALLQVDPANAAAAVLQEFLARDDWPVARLGTLLRGDSAEHAAQPLLTLFGAGDELTQRRLLPLLRFVETPRARGALLPVLERAQSPQLLANALRQVEDPAALPLVRTLGTHADALVRSAAALALGRLGGAVDRERLVALMADRDWWVRYRAAQSLLTLPGVDAAALDMLEATLPDRFARDALAQVRAERRLGQAAAVPA